MVFLFYYNGFMVVFLMDLTWYISGIIVLLWWIYGGTFSYFLLAYKMWLELMALGLVLGGLGKVVCTNCMN